MERLCTLPEGKKCEKIALKTGKIQLEICNILRGKKRAKVINYVGEGIFNVEFGLFQVEFVIFYVDLNTL